MITLHHKCTIFYQFVEQISFCKRTKQGKSNAEPRNIMTALLEAGIADSHLPSELEKAKESFRKENNKNNRSSSSKNNNKEQNRTNKTKKNWNRFSPPLSQYIFSFSRRLRVSQLPRSWKKTSLTRHANLLVNICRGLQRIHKSDR